MESNGALVLTVVAAARLPSVVAALKSSCENPSCGGAVRRCAPPSRGVDRRLRRHRCGRTRRTVACGAKEVTTAPAAANAECDREVSLRPGPLPSPVPCTGLDDGSDRRAPAGIVGVDQNTYLFGFRNPPPATGAAGRFDIDIAAEIARSIFGTRIASTARGRCKPTRVGAAVSVRWICGADLLDHLRPQAQRRVLHRVLLREPRILTIKGSELILRQRFRQTGVRGVAGTTSLSALFALTRSRSCSASLDGCLIMFGNRARSTRSAPTMWCCRGLALQDPNVEVVGPSIAVSPTHWDQKETHRSRPIRQRLLEQIRDAAPGSVLPGPAANPRTVARSACGTLEG